MYVTQQDVRDLLGVDIEIADDSILEEFIIYAQELVRTYIQLKVIDEGMDGNINGTNCTFEVGHAFIADVSGDTIITTADFTISGWTNSDDPFSKVELTVGTFDPLRGIFVLSTAPSSDTYKKITCSYSYYTKAINWKLLSLATAWKAAEIWVKREEFLVPETWVMGSKKIFQRQPWRHLEREFTIVMDKLRALPMSVVAYKKLVFRPRGPAGPEVDTTAAKEIRTKGKYVKPAGVPSSEYKLDDEA